jgi:oligoendopeptidase F
MSINLTHNRLFNHTGGTASIPARKEINEKYKWNLGDIYKSDDEWENDFAWVEKQVEGFKNFEGKLHHSADILEKCFSYNDAVGIKIERLYLYAMLSKDSDMRISTYQAMDDRIGTLYSKVNAASSFINPELLNIPDEKLMEMIKSNNELQVYEHAIKDLLRTKEHTLTKSEEQILALSSEISQTPYNTYSMFTNADLKLPEVIDDEGNKTIVSHAKFYSAIYSKDRSYRERAFKGYLNAYIDYINTFTTLFNGNLKSNIFYANTRKYDSTRAAALDKNNIPSTVYDKLVESVNQNFAPLHRWAGLKKKLLGIDELYPFDVYVTVFNNVKEKKYSYDEAVKIVLASLQIMDDDYLNSLKTAFEKRWVDVYETQAKKSGAYSSGTTYGVHPYVLLNWTDLLNDLFTLTHEMGHNMHSYYTGNTQPFPYANYSIFLAEVASTFNESLLLDYLIENAKSKEEKLFLLEKYLNNITATFYRQVMFAEYEKIVYDKTENGEALTADSLCKLYKEVYQKYWGPEMVVLKEEEYTWARIPHFYYNFYVYQYATGFAASEVLAKKVKTEGRDAVQKYINFLKAGSSDYPINILNAAGVDMNSAEPVNAVSEKMNKILDEMEGLL